MTQTSYSDFGAGCAVLNNSHVSDQGGGAVALAATFADDFSGAALNTGRWSSGSWNGGTYAPNPNSGLLTIQNATGGWVRSNTTYTRGVVEVIAEFGSGAWQHIGFGSDGFSSNRYFIFSTLSGAGNLYARVNNNVSEQNVNLGPIPTGLHRYRVEWSALNAATDRVAFYLDGVFQAQFDVTNVGATNLYLYLSNNGSAPLRVDAAQVAPSYVGGGSYTSCELDAGVGNIWQVLSWDAAIPAGAGLTVETRSSVDGLVWSGWSAVASSGSGLGSSGRYAQYRLLLTTSNSQVSPLVNAVTLNYGLGGAMLSDGAAEKPVELYLPMIWKNP
jgi:hypothetical protein